MRVEGREGNVKAASTAVEAIASTAADAGRPRRGASRDRLRDLSRRSSIVLGVFGHAESIGDGDEAARKRGEGVTPKGVESKEA